MHTMTPSPRDRGRRGHRTYEEEFVLYLQGAVVYDDEHGYPTGLGQIIVKNEDEAWRTFRKLSSSGWEGQPLTVTLARASSPTSPIAGPTRSSSATVPAAAYRGAMPHKLDMPISTEPLRAPSTTAATTSCLPLIPMPHYTPISHGHASHHSFPTALDSGFQSPAWNPHPEMLAFSPTMAVFPPPVDQIEYPYYFPYSLPMPVSMPQPMYTETGPDYEQHRQAPSALPRRSTSAYIMPNSYPQHGYQMYGYEAHKTGSGIHSGTNTYPNDAASYCTTGILSQRTMPMQPTCNIIIDNIRPGVDQQTLTDHFRGAGYMLNCQIIRYDSDENGGRYNEHNYPAQCYATATFSSADEAEKAVKMYNGSDLAGSRVVVRLDSKWDDASLDDSTPSTTTTTATTAAGGGDGGGESDWSRSLSFTTSSTLPLRSSVSESTVASMGGFSAYSESPKPQVLVGTTTRNHRHANNRSRRDSGKELLKSDITTTTTHLAHPENVQEHGNDDKTSDKQRNSTKYAQPSSRSLSPKSRNTEEESLQQPLVVNGSILGKPKM
ncbi:hypothetical protein UA08_05087 [Talaromyces atroroseus]|uniref:RRM domain-containing protein n=1 Tax=Talaromyces atroroseus TaxID=1441469 RepID=A0A225AVH4_TALAT|nr:hypothetical protein UA08_05087 [Talaromyces atroroseus]OKL59599.1 hypothetical protein UA08_05087 [Talaromyces atroroseus]